MKQAKEILLYDDYNHHISGGDVIGAVRQTFSALAFKNGWKIIEVYMKKLIYKGYQWPPYWGGVLFNSRKFKPNIMDGISPTLRSEKDDAGVCVEYQNTQDMAKIYRIRKLTARECFRLMGVQDSDIDKIQAAGISESQQYKLAGNSIVVDTLLYGIYIPLFAEDNQNMETLF